MDKLFTYVLEKTIKSGYFKAWILAQARHLVTAAGAAAVAKGYADASMVEGAMGFVMTACGFYLAALDVKVVDGKIKIALHTEPPEVPYVPPVSVSAKVETDELPPIK